jgi:hypothetical protein
MDAAGSSLKQNGELMNKERLVGPWALRNVTRCRVFQEIRRERGIDVG